MAILNDAVTVALAGGDKFLGDYLKIFSQKRQPEIEILLQDCIQSIEKVGRILVKFPAVIPDYQGRFAFLRLKQGPCTRGCRKLTTRIEDLGFSPNSSGYPLGLVLGHHIQKAG